jgi:hypothetical protein
MNARGEHDPGQNDTPKTRTSKRFFYDLHKLARLRLEFLTRRLLPESMS